MYLGCFRLGNPDFDFEMPDFDFPLFDKIHLEKGFLSVEIRKWISCFIVKSKIRISQSKAPLVHVLFLPNALSFSPKCFHQDKWSFSTPAFCCMWFIIAPNCGLINPITVVDQEERGVAVEWGCSVVLWRLGLGLL